MFSFDVFEPGRSVKEISLAFLMHNVLSIIMIILLVIAWRKEIVGEVSYLGAGLLYVGFVIYNITNSGLPWYIAITWSITIAGPAFIIGILFLINCRKRRENIVRKFENNKHE